MQHVSLRDVSYRQAAPLPPTPPRRLTTDQRSELNVIRGASGIAVVIGTLVSLIAGFSNSWSEAWPSHWHVVVLLGAMIVVPSLLITWATRRLWRDESLGGGE